MKKRQHKKNMINVWGVKSSQKAMYRTLARTGHKRPRRYFKLFKIEAQHIIAQDIFNRFMGGNN